MDTAAVIGQPTDARPGDIPYSLSVSQKDRFGGSSMGLRCQFASNGAKIGTRRIGVTETLTGWLVSFINEIPRRVGFCSSFPVVLSALGQSPGIALRSVRDLV